MEKKNYWLIGLLVLIVLAITCPNRDDHVEAIKTEMENRIDFEEHPLAYFAVKWGTNLGLSAWGFKVNNWIFFSVGKTKDGQLSSFGIFNHVFVFIG